MATSSSLLLGIVFFLEQRIWARCGSVPQPSIWAVPGAVISMGSSVSIFCRIPPGVTQVRLSQITPDGRAKWYDHTPEGSQEVDEFHLQNMMHTNAGIYYCEYCKPGNCSRSEDKLELVVTGVYRTKPSLMVHSGPQAVSGGNVTLQCHTYVFFSLFILCRDGNASFPQNCSQHDDSTFLISPASLGTGRTYRCFGCDKNKPYFWSLPSDPLELSIQGSLLQPSIWAVPGAVVSLGSSVTIFCKIPPGVTLLRLKQRAPERRWYHDHVTQRSEEKAEFYFQNVKENMAGVYFCQYKTEYHWSGQSDDLELVVTGVYGSKPSLMVHSGPQTLSGGTVTLQCHTPDFYGAFILCRDGNASFPQSCSQQDGHTFLVSPASPGTGRTYRCFGFYKDKPYLWSLPSNPLDLSITDSPDTIVVWVSVAAVCLLLILILLLFLCLCRHRTKCRATNGKTRSQVKYKSSSPAMDIEDGNKFDDLEGIQPEDCRQDDTQVPASEDLQEVTYAQLHQETLMGNMNPLPIYTLQDMSTEPCVYATLTLSQ